MLDKKPFIITDDHNKLMMSCIIQQCKCIMQNGTKCRTYIYIMILVDAIKKLVMRAQLSCYEKESLHALATFN